MRDADDVAARVGDSCLPGRGGLSLTELYPQDPRARREHLASLPIDTSPHCLVPRPAFELAVVVLDEQLDRNSAARSPPPLSPSYVRVGVASSHNSAVLSNAIPSPARPRAASSPSLHPALRRRPLQGQAAPPPGSRLDFGLVIESSSMHEPWR